MNPFPHEIKLQLLDQSSYFYFIYLHTNQGGGLLQRSHSHLQFPATSVCIPVALGLCPLEAILARVHIQVPNYFLMRNY